MLEMVLFDDAGHLSASSIPDYPIAYDAAKALRIAASAVGSNESALQWAGQGAPFAREMPAAELVETLMREFHEIIGG